MFFANWGWGQTIVTFPSNGTTQSTSNVQSTWTVPLGVTSIQVEVWGGGGGGCGRFNTSGSGAAGGGGAYARKGSFAVNANDVLYIQVGKQGTGRGTGTQTATDGGISYVKTGSHTGTIIVAAGGGTGGTNVSSLVCSGGPGSTSYTINATSPTTNDDYWFGGIGGDGGCNSNGGSGGGGAGSGGNGSSPTSCTGTASAGGSAWSTSLSGGVGGKSYTSSTPDAAGIRGGGGGGVGTGSNLSGGNGGGGFVRITYTFSPTITTSVSSLNAFTSCSGTASSQQSFTVSGSNLTANLVVTPPTGFEISLTSGASFSTSPISLSPASGTVSSTTIYVRMASQASSPASGNISCTSTGATTKNVSVSGTVATTIPWTDASTGNAFGTSTNWTPNIISTDWKTCHIAQFNNSGSSSNYGINMFTGTDNFSGALSIGAIEVTASRTTNSITIGNSSINSAGTLTLNGASLNTIANTILRNASSQLLTIQNNVLSGNQTMSLALGNATDNIINTDGSGGITISSIISGSSKPLTKIGTGGALTLSGANTFSGATNVNAGTLKLGVSSTSSTSGPLGTNAGGAIVSSGAILDLNGFSLTSSATEALTLNGTGISSGGALLNNALTSSTWVGGVSLASDAGVGGSGDITLSGLISGANSLIKYGTGTLTLSGTNTFGGAGKTISIDNGTVIISSFGNNFGNSSNTFSIGSSTTSATLKFSSTTGTVNRIFGIGSSGGTMENTSTGTVTFDQNAALNGELTANISGASGNIIYSGILSGTGSLKVNSTTTTQVVRLNAVNIYSGSTTITAGILRIGIANAIPSSSNIIMSGGTLSNNSTNFGFTTSGTLLLTSNSTFELGSSGNFNFGASNLVSWTAGAILTITGWQGNPGSAGTGARIFVGSNSSSLISSQLDQINFNGYSSGAMILSTGEIVPKLYHFRTKQSGNWNSASTWEMSSDNSTWINASNSPTNIDATITIRNTHSVTVTGSVTIDQTNIETGGTLNLNSAVILTINDGTGNDIDVTGSFIQSAGTLTNNGQIVVQNGGLFRQAKVGTIIPTATWNSGSTCEVTGWTTTIGGGLNQTFYNFTFNSSNWSSTMTSMEPNGMQVNGLFKVVNTGSGELNLMSGATSRSLTVGSFEITGGIFQISGSNGDANATLNVLNNFLVSGGTFYFQDNQTTSSGFSKLIVGGNITIEGGIVSTDTNAGDIGIYFNGTGSQTYTHSGGTLLEYLRTRFGFKTTSGPISINEVYSHSTIAQTTINGSTMSNNSGYSSWPTTGALINNLTINNANGVTLSTAKTVNGTLNLTNGVLTTTSSNLLYIANTSTSAINGGGTSAYVSGPLKWAVTNSGGTYMYQIGKNGKYAPAGIVDPNAGSTDFMAEYFNADPNTVNYTRTSKESSINNVSACEYWMIDKVVGSASAHVVLSWDAAARSCGITQPNELLVLRWNGTQWSNHWNNTSLITGVTGNGTLTSNAIVSNFSPFTLGSNTTNNPLPVSLLNFKANCINKNVQLNWQTASESNNDFFDIERSTDGLSYANFLRVNGKGTTNEQQNYTAYDEQLFEGNIYYRLKQVDFNGSATYYNPQMVNCADDANISIFPNPNNGNFLIKGLQEESELQLTDALGKNLLIKKVVATETTYEVTTLQEGIYFLLIKSKSGLVQTQKIVVQK
jgi:autotransporter-associated beta strand protein